MAHKLTEAMIKAVEHGMDARKVYESGLQMVLGGTARLAQTVEAKVYMSDTTVTVPEGTVVSIVGVGGGNSGVDIHAQLEDGTQVILPYHYVIESKKVNEALLDVYMKISLVKPFPAELTDFLMAGYMESGVELPEKPLTDTDAALEFFMKAPDQATMDLALEQMKLIAGASFKSADPATAEEWPVMAESENRKVSTKLDEASTRSATAAERSTLGKPEAVWDIASDVSAALLVNRDGDYVLVVYMDDFSEAYAHDVYDFAEAKEWIQEISGRNYSSGLAVLRKQGFWSYSL